MSYTQEMLRKCLLLLLYVDCKSGNSERSLVRNPQLHWGEPLVLRPHGTAKSPQAHETSDCYRDSAQSPSTNQHGSETHRGWASDGHWGPRACGWLCLENVLRVFMRTFTLRLSLTVRRPTLSRKVYTDHTQAIQSKSYDCQPNDGSAFPHPWREEKELCSKGTPSFLSWLRDGVFEYTHF